MSSSTVPPRPARPLLLLVIVATTWAAPAARAQDDPHDTWELERTESPYLLMDDPDDVDRFPLAGTDVAVRIDGVIASVVVRQTYVNEGPRTLHARYVFPASVRAAVHGMSMTVGDRTIRAVVREREEARATFETAKEEGRTATLLEQQRPNVFQMDVANVLPGESLEVELAFSELLVPEDGVYEFVYPTVVGPRYTGDAPPYEERERSSWLSNPFTSEDEAPRADFAFRADLAAGLPVDELACDTHRLDVAWRGRTQAHVELASTEVLGGDRDLILRYRLSGGRVETGLLLQRAPDAESGHFLLMVQPPARVELEDVPPREFVFVLDVSGSMRGQPLDVATDLMEDLLLGLRPTDTFNVMTFAGGSSLWRPRSAPATEEEVAAAARFVHTADRGGSTELAAALARALDLPRDEGVSRSVLVVTDGFISAEKKAFRLVHDHVDDTNVFAFGIGSSVNRYLIEGLARAGQGEAVVVTESRESRAAAERFRAYVSTPVLTGVTLEAEGFETSDVQPERLADLLAQRPLVVTGRWTGEPAGALVVRGTGGRGPFESRLDVGAVTPSADGPLGLLWARRRIAALADWDFGSPSRRQEREILALGLEYGLLTDFTSFVAVTEEVRADGGPADEIVHALPLPRGVPESALGYGVGGGDEPGLLALAALAALVLAGRRFARTTRAAGEPA